MNKQIEHGAKGGQWDFTRRFKRLLLTLQSGGITLTEYVKAVRDKIITILSGKALFAFRLLKIPGSCFIFPAHFYAKFGNLLLLCGKDFLFVRNQTVRPF